MAKSFYDFTFNGKKLSDLNNKYLSADFDNDENIPLALSREIKRGETNRYRSEPNFYGFTWSTPLHFELHIIKDPCHYNPQNQIEFSMGEIREFTRWLTSNQLPQWLEIDTKMNIRDEIRYKGFFQEIQTYSVGGRVVGLRLMFECTTSFGHSYDIVNSFSSTTTARTVSIENNSDELEDYCYPTLEIIPNGNSYMYICNLSDCEVLDRGNVESAASSTLKNVIEDYARLHSYTVEYNQSSSGDVETLCNHTAIEFRYIDEMNNKIKCTAFYYQNGTVYTYMLIKGGFMHMELYTGLNIYADCQHLIIKDVTGRMVTYDRLGISDVDSIYWLRLVNGVNNLIISGDCTINVKHIEARKVGEISWS